MLGVLQAFASNLSTLQLLLFRLVVTFDSGPSLLPQLRSRQSRADHARGTVSHLTHQQSS